MDRIEKHKYTSTILLCIRFSLCWLEGDIHICFDYNNNNNNSQIFPAYAGCGEIPMYTILPLRVLAT